MEQMTIPLSKLIDDLHFHKFYMPENEVLLSSRDINRPGLELTGFFEYYDTTRLLIIGNAERSYLNSLTSEQRKKSIEGLLEKKPPAVLFSRSIKPVEEFIDIAVKYNIPLLGTSEITSTIVAAIVAYLNVELAPRVTRHGVLVEVYGEGILIVGDSGIGKSETAIELVKRGHRLIADDAVEIRKVSAKTLVGTSPSNIKHYIELRGIGIVNVRRVFGVGSIKDTEKIDFIIKLEDWKQGFAYDRMGINNTYTDILGIKIPVVTLPVKEGRNLAVIIEVAAMNHREKQSGYNAAFDMLKNMGIKEEDIEKEEIMIDLEI